jgi:hypothetical protein
VIARRAKLLTPPVGFASLNAPESMAGMTGHDAQRCRIV